jgi:hypothetical protein
MHINRANGGAGQFSLPGLTYFAWAALDGRHALALSSSALSLINWSKSSYHFAIRGTEVADVSLSDKLAKS